MRDQNTPLTVTLLNNTTIEAIQIFNKPFRVNIFINEQYAGRIGLGGDASIIFPEDFLLIMESLTSFARRYNDKYKHKEKEDIVTLHENHYDGNIKTGYVVNDYDKAMYHPNTK